MERSEGPLMEVDRSGAVPVPTTEETTNRKELFGVATVIAIGCLMAFSSGTSNIANAIAPLVGSDVIEMNPAILLGCLAVGIGAFTIARRTLETMGSDITELPLTAAIVVATVSATLVIFLSAIGIPASFVVIATMSIVGLGWGGRPGRPRCPRSFAVTRTSPSPSADSRRTRNTTKCPPSARRSQRTSRAPGTSSTRGRRRGSS